MVEGSQPYPILSYPILSYYYYYYYYSLVLNHLDPEFIKMGGRQNRAVKG